MDKTNGVSSPMEQDENPVTMSVDLTIEEEESNETYFPAPERNVAQKPKRKRKPQKRKSKSLQDKNAPKMPLNGYSRFVIDRKDVLRSEHPDASYPDICKMLGLEWANMNAEIKQAYIFEAEQEREKYQQDLKEYQKSESYKSFQKKIKSIDKQEISTKKTGTSNGTDISIFTEAFMQHNKSRETELRVLRSQTSELEEQNATLGKHIDHMKSAIAKLEVESVQRRNDNLAITSHVTNLKNAVAKQLSQFDIPGRQEKVSAENVDVFLAKVHALTTDRSSEYNELVSEVKAVISKVNLKAYEKQD